MSTKLYVGNLSFDTTTDSLKGLFSEHGNVTDAVVMSDKFTGRSRGFGFITMDSAEAAQAAINSLNGVDFEGRKLTVNEARPKTEGGGRREFSGGGGRREGGRGGRF